MTSINRLIAPLLFIGLLCFGPARGQLATTGAGKPVAAVVGAYTGPLDLIPTWSYFYSLWAPSAAQRGNAVINACNSTGGVDVLCADMVSDVSTGAVDTQTIGGVTCPNALGTCTIKTFYDGSGGGRNATQATVASRYLLENTSAQCGGSVTICALPPATIGVGYLFTSQNIAPPYSIAGVMRLNSPSGTMSFLGSDNAAVTYTYLAYDSPNTRWALFSGSGAAVQNAATGVWTSAQGIDSGVVANVVLDDVLGANGTSGTGLLSTDTGHLGGDGYGSGFKGPFVEGGVIPSLLNSTQYGQLCHNQFTRIGTAASC